MPLPYGSCTGHCCRAFMLPHAPDKLEEASHQSSHESDHQIPGMLISLGQHPRNPREKVIGERAVQNPASQGWFYTCKHLDAEEGCLIYETRPHMCRHYPNGHRCEFEDCTMIMPMEVLVEEAWRWTGGLRFEMPAWSQLLAYGEVRWEPAEALKLVGSLVSKA